MFMCLVLTHLIFFIVVLMSIVLITFLCWMIRYMEDPCCKLYKTKFLMFGKYSNKNKVEIIFPKFVLIFLIFLPLHMFFRAFLLDVFIYLYNKLVDAVHILCLIVLILLIFVYVKDHHNNLMVRLNYFSFEPHRIKRKSKEIGKIQTHNKTVRFWNSFKYCFDCIFELFEFTKKIVCRLPEYEHE